MQMSDVTEPVLTETELEELKGRVAEGDTEAMVDLGMHHWDGDGEEGRGYGC